MAKPPHQRTRKDFLESLSPEKRQKVEQLHPSSPKLSDPTGGTQIVVDSGTGESYVVEKSKQNLAAIEQGRKNEIIRRASTGQAAQAKAEGPIKTLAAQQQAPQVNQPNATIQKAQSPWRSDIAEKMEYPFGRENQRASLSELKQMQKDADQKAFERVRRGEIRASTPKEIERMTKSESATGQFFSGLKSSPEQRGQMLRTGRPAETFGALGRQVVEIALLGSSASAPQAAKSVSTAITVRQAPKAKVILDPVSKFGVDLAKSVGLGITVSEGTKKVAQITATKEQKEIIENPAFNTVLLRAKEAEQQAVSKEGFFRNAGYQVNELFASQRAKQAFDQTARQQLQNLGYSGERLDTAMEAVKRQKKAGMFGEATAFIATSGASELFGRTGLVKPFSEGGSAVGRKVFGETFKKSAPNIARAGVIEGSSQELVQQVNRQQDVNLKNIGMMGTFGGLSAGVLGGTIAGLAPIRPGVSKTIEYTTYVADPFEKPGDLLADLTQATQRNILKQEIKVPAITLPVDPKGVYTFTVTTPTKKPKSPAITPTKQETSVFQDIDSGAIPIIEVTPTKRSLESGTILDSFQFTPTPSPTPTDTITNPIIPDPIIPPPAITPTLTPTDTETTVPVPVPTPIMTPIPIPVFTPILRSPPPLVPSFGSMGDGGKGYGTAGGKRYINELAAGLALLEDSFAGNLGSAFKPISKKKSRKDTKRKNQPKRPQNPFGINIKGVLGI